jgi:hypothetical protein
MRIERLDYIRWEGIRKATKDISASLSLLALLLEITCNCFSF